MQDTRKMCAMCGADLEPAATHCHSCGESVGAPGDGGSDGSSYRPATSLVGWLTALLLAGAVLCLIGAGSSWLEVQLLTEVKQGAEVSIERAEANDTRQGLIGMAQVLVYIVTVVVFARWLHRANQNARALGADDMRFTPGWTVGWFFVPIANLFKPYQAVGEIWVESDPHGLGRGTALLGVWWAAWIISNIAGRASMRANLRAESLDELLAASRIMLATAAIEIPLAVLALLVVRGIHARQEEKHAILESRRTS